MRSWRHTGPGSLTGRVALVAALAVGAALLVAGSAILVASGRADRRALDRDLRAVVQGLRETAGDALNAAATSSGGSPAAVVGLRAEGAPPPLLDPGEGRFARAITQDGSAIVAGAGVPEGFPGTPPRAGLRTVEAAGERWRAVVATLGSGARLEVAAPLTPIESREARLRRIVGGTLLAALAATGLLVRLLAGVALRPLHALRAAAAQVRQTGDLAVRVGSEGPEEVAALGGELDGMLERLERTVAAREAALDSARRFAADAGHELRTPLTSLAANVDLAADARTEPAQRDAALRAAADEAERLRRLVDGLQALARGEAGLAAAGPVDLGELADAAVGAARARHPQLRAELHAPDSGPTLLGDADGLRRLLDNLLENAALHGGDRVRLEVAADGLTVDDNGPGIPEDERAAVLRRFVRGSAAGGPGTGLGLAIVVAEAERHGGRVTLQDAPLGGLRVHVALSAALSADPEDVAVARERDAEGELA